MILHDHVLANWKHWIGDVFVGPFWTDSSNGKPFFFGLLIQGNGWHVVSPAPDGPRESQCDAETSRESKRPKDTRSDLKSFLKRLKHDWRPKASQSALTAWGLTPPIGACPTCPALGIFTISVSSAIKWGGGAKDTGSSTLRTRSAKIKTGTVLTLVTHQNY